MDERPVSPVRAGDRGRLDRLEVPETARSEELLGRRAGLGLGGPRTGRVVPANRFEGREVPERGDRNSLLFLDARPEPPHLPAPDLGVPAIESARPLQAQ